MDVRRKQVLNNTTGQIHSLDCKGQCAVLLPPSTLPADLAQNNELLLGLGAPWNPYSPVLCRSIPRLMRFTGCCCFSEHHRTMRRWHAALHNAGGLTANGCLHHSVDAVLRHGDRRGRSRRRSGLRSVLWSAPT